MRMSVEKHYLSLLSVPNSNTKMKIIRREIKLNNLTLSPRSPRQCIPCSCQWTRRGHHGHVEFALSEWWRGHTLLWSCSATQPQPGSREDTWDIIQTEHLPSLRYVCLPACLPGPYHRPYSWPHHYTAVSACQDLPPRTARNPSLSPPLKYPLNDGWYTTLRTRCVTADENPSLTVQAVHGTIVTSQRPDTSLLPTVISTESVNTVGWLPPLVSLRVGWLQVPDIDILVIIGSDDHSVIHVHSAHIYRVFQFSYSLAWNIVTRLPGHQVTRLQCLLLPFSRSHSRAVLSLEPDIACGYLRQRDRMEFLCLSRLFSLLWLLLSHINTFNISMKSDKDKRWGNLSIIAACEYVVCTQGHGCHRAVTLQSIGFY